MPTRLDACALPRPEANVRRLPRDSVPLGRRPGFYHGCYALDAVGAGALPAFANAHRFFIASTSFLRPSSESPPFFFGSGAGVGAAVASGACAAASGVAEVLALAQRAFAAAASFARCDAEILRFFLAGSGGGVGFEAEAGDEGITWPFKIAANSVSSDAIFSAISTACFN